MSDFLKPSQVFLDNPAKTIDEALEFLSKKAVELGVADDEAAVLKAFKDREAEGSTGIMGGIAIPHGKSDAVKEASMIAVRFTDTIDWKAMDGKAVKVAIGLLTPTGEAGTTHLKMLSQIAVGLMNADYAYRLRHAHTAEEIADVVNEGLSA